MYVSPCSRSFPLNLFNLNFILRVLFWLIDLFFMCKFFREIFGLNTYPVGFTSLLSLNSYFHSICQTIVHLFMLRFKWTPLGMRVLTLLSFETHGFSSWTSSSRSLYTEWWYGDWKGLSNKGLCTLMVYNYNIYEIVMKEWSFRVVATWLVFAGNFS